MKTTIAAVGAVLALAALSGCSGQPEPAPTVAVTASVAQSPTPTPEPTPSLPSATPEQFASLIATYEPDWRETIEEAGDCRWYWVTYEDDDDLTTRVQALSCYLREAAMTMTAETATKKLDALGPPPESMASLVNDTHAALAKVVAADMDGQCGTSLDEIEDEDACTAAAGAAIRAYDHLEDVLNAWRPYL